MTDIAAGALSRAADGSGSRSSITLGQALRQAHLLASDAVSAVLGRLGVEGRHFVVLIALCSQGPMSQSALVETTGCDRSTMVRVVDELERAGLVIRAAGPHDRRVRIVAATEDGRAVFDQAHADAVPVVSAMVAHLRPTEVQQLMDLLMRFAFPGQVDDLPHATTRRSQ
ncbi:MarR family winged helix-turn-helix transcriptional regulator [Streptomyces sp. NPDC001910]|uniref:MarR family winged helix-turn-helix transcriptional regulator n=1 Tax=Streptomyces sp. NPDC001910 TaxID=3154403 RepID=UPI00331F3534